MGFAPRACSAGRGPAGSWTCAATTCASTLRMCIAAWTTRLSAAARGWCFARSRCSPASRRLSRPARSTCSDRGEHASTRRWLAIWRPARVSACCAAATKASTTACASTWSTASLSIGDYVLAGGEVAACVVIEAVTRLLPGVMGNTTSAERESFGRPDGGLLEEPQYTRPASFRGWEVPEILRSGDHARVARWRRAQALHRTVRSRPDLIAARGGLSRRKGACWKSSTPSPILERPLRAPPFSRRRTSAP